jgi:hypothetical protein
MRSGTTACVKQHMTKCHIIAVSCISAFAYRTDFSRQQPWYCMVSQLNHSCGGNSCRWVCDRWCDIQVFGSMFLRGY